MSDSTEWPADARRDRLIGDWHLYQRTEGHRTSTDDLITGWYAVHRHPQRPASYLDPSVWGQPPQTCTPP